MATQVWELWPSRDGSASTDGGRALTRSFHVATDAPASAVSVVNALSAATGIVLGAPHPDWSTCYCLDIRATPESEDPCSWNCAIRYSEPRGQQDGSSQGFNPTNATETETPQPPSPGGGGGGGGGGSTFPPPKGSMRSKEEYRNYDRLNVPFRNSIGDMFENSPPTLIPDGSMTVSRFYPGKKWSLRSLAGWQFKTNSTSWGPFLTWELCLLGFEWEWRSTGWQVNWSVGIDTTNGFFQHSLLNTSYRYLEDVGDKQVFKLFTDSSGNPVNQPQPITLAGRKLNGADPVFVGFSRCIEADFSALLGSFFQ